MSRSAFEGEATEEHFVLTINRGGKKLNLDIWLFKPHVDQRYPAIVKNCFSLFDAKTGYGNLPADPLLLPAIDAIKGTIARDTQAAHEAVKREYLLCKFNREQLAIDLLSQNLYELAGPDQPNHREVGIYPLYPEHDWGAIAVWAWGHSVVLDALDQLGYVDMGKTVVTGHSRGGQAAMAAGIYDERIAVATPSTGGYGSCGTLRIRDSQGVRGTDDYIETVISHGPHWHLARFHDFSSQRTNCHSTGTLWFL